MGAPAYALRQAVGTLWRRRRAALGSTLTITVALLVVSCFLILAENLQELLARWSSVAEVSVYLRDDASVEQQAAVERVLAASGIVAGREYVSKAEAIARFKRDFPDLAAAAEDEDTSPFPASIEVRLRPEGGGDAVVEQLAGTLARTPGVADVRYDRRWLDRLARLAGFVRAVGWTLAAVLVLGAALTVASVVRLSLHERRDEIEIMELVGAPPAYIRGPFLVEGTLQGGAGAVLALLAAWGAFGFVQSRFASGLADLLDPSAVQFLGRPAIALVVAGGMLLGGLGGFVASREPVAPPASR